MIRAERCRIHGAASLTEAGLPVISTSSKAAICSGQSSRQTPKGVQVQSGRTLVKSVAHFSPSSGRAREKALSLVLVIRFAIRISDKPDIKIKERVRLQIPGFPEFLVFHISLMGAKFRAHGIAERGIGDVRGEGMVFGAEPVLDRDSKAPATAFADRVVNALRHHGILLSKLGRHRNTLKIRPAMPFGTEHVDLLIDTLDAALSEIPLAP